MKVEKLVEQRIEKHLELGEKSPKDDIKVINAVENVPTVIDSNENKDNDFQYARENLYDIIEKG